MTRKHIPKLMKFSVIFNQRTNIQFDKNVVENEINIHEYEFQEYKCLRQL